MSRKVNYYILVYSDNNIKYGNYVKVIAWVNQILN